MATGIIKRRDTEPAPELTINNPAGSAYDLTDHTVKFIMGVRTTLGLAMDDSVAEVDLPAGVAAIVELDDNVLLDNERVKIVAPLPTFPIATANATFNCSRGWTVAATAGAIIGSLDVISTFVLSDDADFNISVDGEAAVSPTLLAVTTAGNTLLSQIVTQLQAVIDTATGVGASCTVSSLNGKLVITSDTTGVLSSVVIDTPDAITSAELGIIAATGTGAAALVTTASAHAVDIIATILKIENTAIIKSPPTDGIVTFEFVEADTEKPGTYIMEFEVTTPSGRQFTSPNDLSFTLDIIADLNDRVS